MSEALYLPHPDGNGVELYWDRPTEEWPKNSDGSLNMYTRALEAVASGNGVTRAFSTT